MLSQLSYTPAAVAHCEADLLVGSSRACCIGNLERNEPVQRADVTLFFRQAQKSRLQSIFRSRSRNP